MRLNEQRLFGSDPCRSVVHKCTNKTALIVMDKLIFEEWIMRTVWAWRSQICTASDMNGRGTSLFHVVIYSLWLIHGWREYSGSAAPRWAEPSSPLQPWRHMTTAARGVHAQIWAQSQEVCRSQVDQNPERLEPHRSWSPKNSTNITLYTIYDLQNILELVKTRNIFYTKFIP